MTHQSRVTEVTDCMYVISCALSRVNIYNMWNYGSTKRHNSPFNVFESRGIKASDTTRRGKSFTFANVVIQAWWIIATTSPS